MAIRSKKGRAPNLATPTSGVPAAPKAAPVTAPPPQSTKQDAASTTPIRKGIYLSALIYIEGEQPPAADFAAISKSALAAALTGDQKGLNFTVKRVEVQNNIEDDESDGNGTNTNTSKDGGFEF